MGQSRTRAHPPLNADLPTRLGELLGSRPRHRLDSLSAVPAAVLVPLFLHEDALHVLYTRRTDSLPHHGGQVAFPGGQHEPNLDDSLLATAVREAREEVGLLPEHTQILGGLDDIKTLATNFVITPFVGLIPHPYRGQPNPHEVAEIFSVPLVNLRDPASRHREERVFNHRKVTVSTIQYGEHVIWGATERISLNLVEALAALDGCAHTP